MTRFDGLSPQARYNRTVRQCPLVRAKEAQAQKLRRSSTSYRAHNALYQRRRRQMQHNVSPDVGPVPVLREEQMQIYDLLPPEWRQLIGTLPTPQDLRVVREILEKLGPEDGLLEIVRQFVLKYPGWRPQI